MESLIWHSHAGSLGLCRGGWEEGQQSLFDFLSGRKISPSTWLDARHLISSLYATGAFQAATLVLSFREIEYEWVCVWFLREKMTGTLEFLLLNSSPFNFAARNNGNLSSLWWKLGLQVPVVRCESLSQNIPHKNFPPRWIWDLSIPCLHPSFQSGWMWMSICRLTAPSITVWET